MDWVITGEGQIDFQTQFGKGPGMLAKTSCPAWRASSRIAGSIAADARKTFERGFHRSVQHHESAYGSHGRDERRAQLMERTAGTGGAPDTREHGAAALNDKAHRDLQPLRTRSMI